MPTEEAARNNRISTLEKDVGIIQKENEIQTRVFLKFEEAIEKMQDLTESMHRLVSLHDERINVQGKTVDSQARTIELMEMKREKDLRDLEGRLSKRIDDTETRILEKIAELKTEKDQAVEKKANDEKTSWKTKLSSWKYFIIGGLLAVGIILGKTTLVSNIVSVITALGL